MKEQCGFITIDKLKHSWEGCMNVASWLSPKRLRTKGKLKVCSLHRKDMEKDYRDNGVEAMFTPIVHKYAYSV